MLQQLRDLIAFPDLVRLGAQVLDEYDNLATIPSINHSGVAHQTLARQARTSLHDAARSWHELNCNSSMDTESLSQTHPCAEDDSSVHVDVARYGRKGD